LMASYWWKERNSCPNNAIMAGMICYGRLENR
jgi:hypothetical protein